MKKKLLYLIPLVVIGILLGLVFNKNENITKSQLSFLDIKLASYVDVQTGDNLVDGTDNVKFDAYFLTDKDNDGIADKIRGNCLEVGKLGKLNVDLNVTGDSVLSNIMIRFTSNNVDVGYNSSYTSVIPLEDVNGGTNKTLKLSLRERLSNDISSYSKINKVILTGTLVENGETKQITKEVEYQVDWYRTSLSSFIASDYTTDVKTENDIITVKYNFTTTSNTTSLLKSINLDIDVPSLNNVQPSKVTASGTNIHYNFNSETNKLTISRVAELSGTKITNNVYDYIEYNSAINNFEVRLEYPVEAGLVDGSLPLKVSVNHELYNNPADDFTDIITSNPYSRVLIATSKSDDVITSINEGGPVPYLIGVDATLSSTSVIRKPVYEDLKNKGSSTYGYDVSSKIYYTLGKINKVMIYDEDFDKFNGTASTNGIITYNSIRFTEPTWITNILGEDGYIKLIDGETNELITIFNKDTWNETFYFDSDVRKIYIETSSVEGIAPKYCRTHSECVAKYTTFLRMHVEKKIDNYTLATTYSASEFDNLSYIRSNMTITLEGENVTTHNVDSKTAVIDKRYETARSSNVKLTLDKNSFSTNEAQDIQMLVSTSNIDNVHYGWVNGEFLVEIPKEIIDININNVAISNSSVELVSYELVKQDDVNLIKLLTKNTDPSSFMITIDATITPDPRVSDVSKLIRVYGVNSSFALADNTSFDVYDLNNNGRTNDYVNYDSAHISFEKSNDVRTITLVKVYDKDNNERVVVTPKVTEVYPLDDNSKAKIEISLVNNSTDQVQDIKFIGKVGYVGNTYRLNNTPLGTEFNVPMTSDGISVPSELADKTTVYYSPVVNPTDDLIDGNNYWFTKDNVPSFDIIKSYMIVVNDYQLDSNKSITFTYEAEMPMNANLINKTAYFTHAVYYNALTESGLITADPIEQKKTGLTMVRKYNLSLTDYKLYSSRVIDNSMYILTDEDNNQRIIKTDLNGNISVKNLYVGKRYRIRQQNVDYPYILDEEEKSFKVINGVGNTLELSGNENGLYRDIKIDDVSTVNNSKKYNFDYTGGEQVFVAPKAGIYKLEVWGAQGGNAKNGQAIGGYGGYSTAEMNLSANQVLYINVGGRGTDSNVADGQYHDGGYNGGGKTKNDGATVWGSGGGATHIATTTGLLKDVTKSNLLLVAGGGGGAGYYYYSNTGGSGGGYQGANGTGPGYGTGGTQTTGGTPGTTAFGGYGYYGIGGQVTSGDGGGGGGGLYGGASGYSTGSGSGGGSGYINSSLSNKIMFCYNCSSTTNANYYTVSTTSTNSLNDKDKCPNGYSNNAISKCAKANNGYVAITYLGNPSEVVLELKYDYGVIDQSVYEYSIGSTIGNLPSPILANQNVTFAGWYSEPTYQNRITSDSIINENMKAYAKYIDNISNNTVVSKYSANSIILNVDLENDTRYDFKLTNTDLDTNALIPGSKFKITGKGYESGEVLRTNTNGEIYLTGLSLDEEYTLEQVSSLDYLIMAEPFKFYLTRNPKNGAISLTKQVELPTNYGSSVALNSTVGFSGDTNYYTSNSHAYGGVDEAYIELDLTDYGSKYKIDYQVRRDYSHNSTYYLNGNGYKYKIFAVTDINHIPDMDYAFIPASTLSNTLTTAYSYNSATNSYDSVPIEGGRKYYIYLYSVLPTSNNTSYYDGYAYFSFGRLQKIDGTILEDIYETTNVVASTNENIIQNIIDGDNQEVPMFVVNVNSKQVPTYTLELTKVSSDTKEPLKDAQYKLTGYGLSVNGEYIKTDENGKATIELKKTIESNTESSYKVIINGFDYSTVDGTYDIQEVVPPEGYQIDNRKVSFNFKTTYSSTNCSSSYTGTDYVYRCAVDDNTYHVNHLVYPSLDSQFVEYEYDESIKTLKVTMYDYPLIDITKKDSETGELLPNTLFAVYSVSRDENGNEILEPAKDTKGNILGMQVEINNQTYYVVSTNENGKLVLALTSGKYKALEVQAANEKYRIDETGYYFSVGSISDYDDTRLKFFNSINEEYSGYCYEDSYYSPCNNQNYTDIIPTSDGGWLVGLDGVVSNGYSLTDDGTAPITIKKYDADLNVEWESDARVYLKKERNQYTYYDNPTKVMYEDVDTSYTYGRFPIMHLEETTDGYYVDTHNLGVIKFDKNGNRLWQTNDYSKSVAIHFTGVCNISDGKPAYPNEYFSDWFGGDYAYDANNPYIQRDASTYYCHVGPVYDATLEEAGGILRYQISPDTGEDIDALFNSQKKYDGTLYDITEETENIYDDDNNIIETKEYRVFTPRMQQNDNSIRLPYVQFGGQYSNYVSEFGIKDMVATPDGGVTLLSARNGESYPYYLLSDGTTKVYGQYSSGGSGYKRIGNECNVWANDNYVDRSDCVLTDLNVGYNFQLLHYSSDGRFVSVDNLGRIYYYAIKKYNEEHGTNIGNGITSSNSDIDNFSLYAFENGDLLFHIRNNWNSTRGFLRIRFNNEKQIYDPVYYIPYSESGGSPMVQIVGNSFAVKTPLGGTITYIDESGNISEEINAFGPEAFYFIPGYQSMMYNGFYRLDNGNYIVYAQVDENNKHYVEDGMIQYNEGMQDGGITLTLNGQKVYNTLTAENRKMYFIVYEINPNSEIIWYKYYYTMDKPDNYYNLDLFSYRYWYTPIRYNKVSNEMLLTILKMENFHIKNVNNPDESFDASGNRLLFRLNDNNIPEAPEAYSIEVLNERKIYNINVNSGENGVTQVLNGDNVVYNVTNETKDVENIKYGDDSIFTIKPQGNIGFILDEVLVDGEAYPYTVLEDGTVVLDKFTNVRDDINLTITFKPGDSIVIVHHYLKGTTDKIASDELISGLVNAPYETEPTLNPLYILVKGEDGKFILPNNMTGFFAASPTIVTYYYEENLVNLKVNYYINNTTLELAPSDISQQKLGSTYKTSKKTILGYDVVNVIGNEEGTLNQENTEVTYMYQSVDQTTIKIRYIDKDTGNDIADTITKIVNRNSEYETNYIDIDGYEYFDRTSNYQGIADTEEIEVIYYYVKPEVKPEEEENPKTGDNIIKTIKLLTISIIGLVMVIIYKKHKTIFTKQ